MDETDNSNGSDNGSDNIRSRPEIIGNDHLLIIIVISFKMSIAHFFQINSGFFQDFLIMHHCIVIMMYSGTLLLR